MASTRGVASSFGNSSERDNARHFRHAAPAQQSVKSGDTDVVLWCLCEVPHSLSTAHQNVGSRTRLVYLYWQTETNNGCWRKSRATWRFV